MSLRSIWWWSGLALTVLVVGFSALVPKSGIATLTTVLLVLWAIPTLSLGVGWLWRRLTYRIGVRLLLSYLLIGVVPFPLMLSLLALGGYILIGQYASVRFADRVLRARQDLERICTDALTALEEAGQDEALASLRAASDAPQGDLARVQWLLATGDESWRSEGAEHLGVPGWLKEGTVSGPFISGGRPALAAIGRRGETIAAALVPLDESTAKRLNEGSWYAVRFLTEDVSVRETEEGVTIKVNPSQEDAEVESDPRPTMSAEDRQEPSSLASEPLWRQRWILFFRLGSEPTRWEDGTQPPNRAFLTLIRTSPAEAAEDLFRSPYQLGRGFLGVFLSVSVFALVLYLAVVAVAVFQIVSITRSTARLTRGTRQVEAGNLEYRIPVRRRDQLGDLAAAFNRMTAAVQEMLLEVGEKERLKRELELAREIQQNLLPDLRFSHGSLSVNAFFRPAAEVGGDYFDLFPIESGRLIVAVGDVAGHGLHTGLLMAMVKSAVATLIREGHREGELLERLNSFMLEQSRDQSMVTLVVAEIDAERGEAVITNAGHPPALCLASDGQVREVLLPALPVGHRWTVAPKAERVKLGPAERLFFYSDGLVEARNREGEPFGFESLRETLRGLVALPSPELLPALLRVIEEHTGDRTQEDDLTMLIVDHAPARAAPAS